MVITGCRAGTAPKAQVWLAEWDSIRPGLRTAETVWDRPPDTDPRTASGHSHLTAAVNETVNFMFVVEPESSVIERPDLHVSPLIGSNGRIDATAISVYRAHRVPAGPIPGWHIRSLPPNLRDPAPLDLLVPIRAPRSGLPATLLPGQAYVFWVDIKVPKGTFSGTYNGGIELRSGGTSAGRIGIELEIMPFVLPDENSTPLLSALDHRALFRHHLRHRGVPYAPPTDDWRSDPHRSELDALLRSTMQTLRDHRITPILPDFSPIVRVNRYRTFDVEWSAYNDLVGPIMNGRYFDDRIPAFTWPIPTAPLVREAQKTSTTPHMPSRQSLDQHIIVDYLQKCAAHFETMGWLDRAYVSINDLAAPLTDRSLNEPPQLFNVSTFRRFEVSPSPPALSHGFPQDMTPYGWIGFRESTAPSTPGRSGLPRAQSEQSYHQSTQTQQTNFAPEPWADIWAPPGQFFDPVAMHAERAKKRKTWVAVDRPPFSGTIELGAPPGCILALPWQFSHLGAEAGMLGTVNHWPPSADAPGPSACIEHDAQILLYPGAAFGLTSPVPSIRLKLLRRAMQDAAYARLLRQRGKEQIAEALTRSLVAYAGTEAYRTSFADGRRIGFVLDATSYDVARRIMANELVDAHRKRTDETSEVDFSRTAIWRRLMLSLRGVELLPEGCRLRLESGLYSAETSADPVIHPQWVVECWLSIINRTRIPLDGTLRWQHLPPGWYAAEDQTPLQRVVPGQTGRALLSITTQFPEALLDSGGTPIELPIELIEATGRIHAGSVRLAFVTAAPRTNRKDIDGDLSDWPPGRKNVASDFRLISGPPPTQTDAERWPTHPRFPTLAFVARDENALYMALRCSRDPATPLIASSTNVVRHDDLIPLGEELVEILLDPLNGGTRSPSDLYRIVIKPTGAYLAERGLRTDPPSCERHPWPADIHVAARIYNDYWTAEVRIPFTAFGDSSTSTPAIWGLNFTRFDASNQSFSTWSGAVGNAYDPLSLGNLLLPAWPEPLPRP